MIDSSFSSTSSEVSSLSSNDFDKFSKIASLAELSSELSLLLVVLQYQRTVLIQDLGYLSSTNSVVFLEQILPLGLKAHVGV